MFILNFHGLGEPTRELPSSEKDCWLDAGIFEMILDLILWRQDVRITFDDTNESDFSIALPLLKARNLSAQFFVVAGRIGQESFLSTAQLLALRAEGMAIGNHGMWHSNWRDLSDQGLEEELVQAKDSIEQIIGASVLDAACPYGAYDHRVLKRLVQLGYHAVYTSDGGPASLTSWLRPRNTVRRSHDIGRILRSISEVPRGLPGLWRRLKLLIKRWR